jgi:hypothetical protein
MYWGKNRKIFKIEMKDLIAGAILYPVEERVNIVDSILGSLSLPDSYIDRKWVAIARQRIADLGSGEIKT